MAINFDLQPQATGLTSAWNVAVSAFTNSVVGKPAQAKISPATVDCVDWIGAHFFIPELKGPIKLYPHQIAALREAHRKNEDGTFVYNVVVWSDIKKSAKSTIAAAVALYRAYAHDWGSIKIVANDLKQAESRVAYYLRRAVTLNPSMADIKQRNYRTTLSNRCTIEAIPIDPGGEAGGNDDLIIFSELWAARHKAIQQMWTEMTLSPTKFGYSQRWIETYAGFTGESPILEQLWERGTSRGERLDLSYDDNDLSDLEIYAEGDMLLLWNDRPRLPWQTKEYYAAEMGVLTEIEFSRIHRNQWASSTAKFVPDEWWDACEQEILSNVHKKPMVLGVDAAVSGDGCALVGVTNEQERTHVRYSRLWMPPKGGKLDYQGTQEQPGIELEIIRLCTLYNVVEVRYDPYQLHDMMTRLKNGVWVDASGKLVAETYARARKLRVNTVAFSQQNPRAVADKQLYDKIRERRIHHSGERDLAQHIGNANAEHKDDSKLRMVKRNNESKIDLAVALSQAAYEPENKTGEAGAW